MTGVSVDSHQYQDFVSIRDASEDDDVGRFLKNRNALYWQIRNRQRNGLDDASAVFKGKDGQYDCVLGVGGTHLFLRANTVFPELKVATDAVSSEVFKPKEACYQ